MTFEEFFNKKKIDLEALATGKPELFAELKDHYEQMSEKSFDHTKKFWFNKLRLQFPLKEEVKVAIETEKGTEAKPVSVEETTVTAPKTAGGYKPMFRQKTNPSNQ